MRGAHSTTTSIRIKGSLALRVFLSSLLFLVVPLIFYTAFTYKTEYERALDDVFESLDLSLKDQLRYVEEVARLESKFIDALYELVQSHPPQGMSEILSSFVIDSQISSILYLKKMPDGTLPCLAASQKALEGKNFEGLIDLDRFKGGDKTFLGKSPDGHFSVYLLKVIPPGPNGSEGLIAMTVSLDLLLQELRAFGTLPQAYVSLVALSGEVLATTHPNWMDKVLFFEEERSLSSDRAIPLLSTHEVLRFKALKGGFECLEGKEKRLAQVKRIGNLPLQVVIDVPKSTFTEQVEQFFAHLVELLTFILVVGGGVTYIFTLRMARPLRQLCEVMHQGEGGDLDVRYQKDRFGFEVNEVGREYNLLMEKIKEMIKEIRQERSEKERYATQMALALEIQKSLLPTTFDFKGLKVSTLYLAAVEVAGDLYDCLKLDDGKVLFCICDVAGKGLQACLYSLGFRSLVRSVATFEHDLANIARKVNQLYLKDTANSTMFVTAWIGIYDETTHQLQYASFGHPPAFLRRHDAPLISLKTTSIPFGIQPLEEVEIGMCSIVPQDLLLLYTDGVTEAMSEQGEMFGSERLEHALSHIDIPTPSAVVDDLERKIRHHSAPALHDDVSILAILFE